MTSWTSVDLPEPETPVTQTSTPSGMSTSTPLRLCSDAPRTPNLFLAARRCFGSLISASPRRYFPVSVAPEREENLGGDGGCFGRERERVEEEGGVFDRERADIGERPPADAHVSRLLPQTPAAAVGAERVAAVLGEEDADVQLVLLRLQPLEEAAHAAPTLLALDDGALLLPRQLLKGNVERNPLLLAETAQLRARPVVLRLRPRLNRALGERELRVRDDEVEVEADGVAEALAGRARAEGVVEAEEARLGLRVNSSVVLALEALGEFQ